VSHFVLEVSMAVALLAASRWGDRAPSSTAWPSPAGHVERSRPTPRIS